MEEDNQFSPYFVPRENLVQTIDENSELIANALAVEEEAAQRLRQRDYSNAIFHDAWKDFLEYMLKCQCARCRARK